MSIRAELNYLEVRWILQSDKNDVNKIAYRLASRKPFSYFTEHTITNAIYKLQLQAVQIIFAKRKKYYKTPKKFWKVIIK